MPLYYRTIHTTKSFSTSFHHSITSSIPISGMTVKTKLNLTSKPSDALQPAAGKKASKTSPIDFTSFKTHHPLPLLRSQLFRPKLNPFKKSKLNPLLSDLGYNGWSKENNQTATSSNDSAPTNPIHTSLNFTHPTTHLSHHLQT